MSSNFDHRQTTVQGPKRQFRDVPGCIKYILLLFLLILFFAEIYAGEFNRFPRVSWIIWLILFVKLILIIGLLILIWVQRHLNCQITAPIGCATKEYDRFNKRLIIRVTGTASGTVFGHYTLAVTGGAPIPVIYPGGGASGTAPVTNGELGQLNISATDPADDLTITLTVFPAGAGSHRTCSQIFHIQRRFVRISKIGNVPARVVGAHPVDSTEPLKLIKVNALPTTPEASLGGSISVEGSADVKGCRREMSQYVLQYREIPSPDPPFEQDAPGSWDPINGPLDFGDATHPRVYLEMGDTLPNYVLNGTLTRQWVFTPKPQSSTPGDDLDQWVTEELDWNTGALNGRFTVRLRVQHQPTVPPPDAVPPEIYDSATVWMDNRVIEARITHMAVEGGGGLAVCDELLLSQFVQAGHKVNAEILGRAWDPIILDSYPSGDRPNNNFNQYVLDFKKDGGTAFTDINISSTRVPNILQQSPLPAFPGGTGVLAAWDIVAALDAGPLPGGTPPDPSPRIYRGQRCAYLLRLQVTDTTRVNDAGGSHHAEHDFPFCIVNDLPQDTTLLPFPVPA